MTTKFGQQLWFEEGSLTYSDILEIPVGDGPVHLRLSCPRSITLWIADRDGNEQLVLDETLDWRSFQREVDVSIVLFGCPGGNVPFRVTVAERPQLPQSVVEDCPSRNRERILAALAEQFPDCLTIQGHVEPDSAPHSPVGQTRFVSLRHSPMQYRKQGQLWQHVAVSTNATSLLAMDCPYGSVRSVPKDSSDLVRIDAYVPVTPPGEAVATAPPLRSAGEAETRIEPVIEATGTVDVRITTSDLLATVSIPVYESLGRIAADADKILKATRSRYFAEDDYAKIASLLPQPVLPASLARFSTVHNAAWKMLLRLRRHPHPESGIPGDYIATSNTGFPDEQFVWDTCFTTLSAAYGWRAAEHLPVYGGMDLLLSRQFDGGYIHREHDTRTGLPVLYEPDFSPNPPLLAIAEWQLASLTGNRERLNAVYPTLADHHRWIAANRRLPDGTYWTTGLANGLDNSPSLGDGYPDLSAQMAHDAETLGKIAAVLGKQEEATAWRHEREQTVRALNASLWDDTQRIYSSSLPGGGHNPNKVVTAFWPLWAGAVPEDRITALCAHLQDERSFWRHHPLPSLAADSPHFEPGGFYWRGSVWAPTTFAAISGFARAGQWKLARRAAMRHLHCVTDVWEETGKLWENYGSEASVRGSVSQADYCWTALGPIALLYEVLLGVRPNALEQSLEWTLPDSSGNETIGIRTYPLGAATVHVEKQGSTVVVTTDAPITLHLLDDTRSAIGSYSCASGTTQIKL